jgi:hypothetical protein
MVIGKALRLECKPGRLPINGPASAGERAIQLIAGIELQPRLVGEYFEHSAALWLLQTRGETLGGGRVRHQHEIMVVTLPVQQLLVGTADARASHNRPPEIEQGALNGPDLTGRYLHRIGRQKRVGGDRDAVAEYVARRGTGQVEIGVRAEADDGRCCGPRHEVQCE